MLPLPGRSPNCLRMIIKHLSGAAAIALAAVSISGSEAASHEGTVAVPSAAKDVPPTTELKTAVLAGGCFWGVEAVYRQVRGVRDVTAGYAGGTAATANYADVSAETTRHAEAVRIRFDPRVVSYATLLRIYFSVAHDPTQVNRQLPDVGTSYRSAIFPQTAQQREVAAAYIAQIEAAHVFALPIATRVEGGSFFPAEAEHQDFFRRNPYNPYITRWDKPKVKALHASFPDLTN